MSKNPLEVIAQNDQEFFDHVMESRNLTFKDGVLSAKTKNLMAMALDAAMGAEAGVGSLASQAMKAGATKAEIMETVRVAGFISGAHAVFTAAHGLDEIL